MVIGTDWIGNCRFNYHMIMTTTTFPFCTQPKRELSTICVLELSTLSCPFCICFYHFSIRFWHCSHRVFVVFIFLHITFIIIFLKSNIHPNINTILTHIYIFWLHYLGFSFPADTWITHICKYMHMIYRNKRNYLFEKCIPD